MVFTEGRFLVFLAVVLAAVSAVRPRHRAPLLLAASYAFYAGWDARFLLLIAGSTAIDYTVGLGLAASSAPARRRTLLAASLVVNLGMLGVFKYLGFFADSAVALAAQLGLELDPLDLRLVLPVGISFYTFQSMGYAIDVYRGRQEPVRDPVQFALFVAFFPQLVAGPIVRASELVPQLARLTGATSQQVRRGLVLLLSGFWKKAVLADGIAPYVDAYFRDPALYDATSAKLAVVLYSAQIYCDFSGYTDLALGVAALLGVTLPENFRWPYLAGDVRAFWRRWHISLSTWLRDYVYIPLGGSRGSGARTAANLMITMVLGGLWHGAGWNFALWGALHGAALVALRARSGPLLPERMKAVRVLATYLWVCTAWIFFRAESISDAWVVLGGWLWPGPGTGRALPPEATGVILALCGAYALAYRLRHIRWDAVPATPIGLAAWSASFALALQCLNPQVRPFVYFQF